MTNTATLDWTGAKLGASSAWNYFGTCEILTDGGDQLALIYGDSEAHARGLAKRLIQCMAERPVEVML